MFNILTIMNELKRKAGVLLHPTSLPGKYGIGTLGKAAFAFVDKLEAAHVSLWQILPLGPTGFGDSPYAARSTFAGNELLIDLETLYLDDLLDITDLVGKSFETERVDYGRAREFKMPLLRKAARKFLKSPTPEYAAFCSDKAWWLDDYALYSVLVEEYNDSRWFLVWPEELRKRDEAALAGVRKEKAEEIEIVRVLQYFFFSQWNALKEYANEHGVEIIGDIPIFVAPDSVDAWTNAKLLKLDEECRQEASSGVPPDAFSATGQLWGNPLYRWEEHEKTGFAWWISRLRETLKMCDIVRIDHFRGFAACWEVPAGEDTAINGKWVPAPGQKLLDAFKGALGDNLPIIAEDLGVITEDVEALRDGNGLPGMKILQFAFGFDDDGEFDTTNAYLPHNVEKRSVMYTGTHDNNTTLGWYRSLGDKDKDYVRRYLETDDGGIVYKMIRAVLSSTAAYAIIPVQDVLALDENARMNVPSTCGSSNWSWKMSSEMLADENNFSGLKYYIDLYGRKSEHNPL